MQTLINYFMGFLTIFGFPFFHEFYKEYDELAGKDCWNVRQSETAKKYEKEANDIAYYVIIGFMTIMTISCPIVLLYLAFK